MHIVLGLVLIAHAFAHLAGFVVPWRIGYFKRLSYKTTIFGGGVDVGDKGIRIVGILWAVLAAAFVVCAVGVFLFLPWWRPATLTVSVVSLFICIASWPDSRAGIIVNAAIILLLVAGEYMGWLQAAGI